jgi:glycosyltransferase involved in cell wall biosynthesis
MTISSQGQRLDGSAREEDFCCGGVEYGAEIWYNMWQICSSKEMRVSVVIPCYNLVSYVDQALESVSIAARQFGGELEVICVDDGSVDGTGEKLEGWRGRFGAEGRIKYEVLHQANGGEGAARNAGLGVATGDWISFLDGDDLWGEWILKAAEEEIEADGAADLIAFRLEAFEGEWRGGHEKGVGARVRRDVTRLLSHEVLMACGVVPTFFRREVFEGIRFSGLTLGADRLYMAECLCRAKDVILVDAFEYGYRMRGDSMAHREWSAKKVGSMLDYALGALGVFERSGKELDGKALGYLCDVMMGIARKQIGRMKDVGERREAARKWVGVLKDLGARKVPRKVRFMRAWYLFVAGRMLKGASE